MAQQLRQAQQQQQDLQDRLKQLNALLDNKVKVDNPDDAFRLQTVSERASSLLILLMVLIIMIC